MAHELIHALAYLNGTSVKDGTKVDYIYENENGVKMKVLGEEKEETDTVGLTGSRKYTENKIRKEQGWGKRVKYGAR